MRVLVIECETQVCRQICHQLEQDGHQVLSFASNREAAPHVQSYQPEMVLLDARLLDTPDRAYIYPCEKTWPNAFTPLVLTHVSADEQALSHFTHSGAMDYLGDPTCPAVLRAKLLACQRLRNLHEQIEQQRCRMAHELRLAHQMFARVRERNPSDVKQIRHWSVAAGHFSGDLIVYARGPDQSLYAMLGDFTGHGLPAAVGSLPASEAFYAMSEKGLPLADIAAELNRKLHALLPTGHFCCAALLHLQYKTDRLQAWLGGTPPLLLLDKHGRIMKRVASTHYPLGIVGPARFDPATEWVECRDAAHLILCSDGVVEARDPAGESYGEGRLAQALDSTTPIRHDPLGAIKHHLLQFMQGTDPHDDISLLSLELLTDACA